MSQEVSMRLSATQRACLEQARKAGSSGIQIPLHGASGWVRADGGGSRWRNATVAGLAKKGLLREERKGFVRMLITEAGLAALGVTA